MCHECSQTLQICKYSLIPHAHIPHTLFLVIAHLSSATLFHIDCMSPFFSFTGHHPSHFLWPEFSAPCVILI